MNLKIREFRDGMGLTQRQFAKSIKKSVGTVQSWEAGDSYPNAEAICVMCELFGTDPNTLLGWYDDHPQDAPRATFTDSRQARMNDAYARLSETAKDLAAGAVIGMMQNDCARGEENVQDYVDEGAA